MVRIPGSKTAVPELPADFIPRPALLAVLDQATPAQLITVIAPAGYGKTLLLADWVRRRDRATAWVCIDRDDDAARLMFSVLTVVRALPGVLRDSPLARVAANSGADFAERSARDLADELYDALDGIDPPVRLVLDDVHKLTDPHALRIMARWVRRSPAGLRLVLAGRADPPLGLARLRVESRLLELRAERLQFTVRETDALLRGAGLVLDPDQAVLLHQRTEGWPAGLRLATAALLRTDDIDAFLAGELGEERTVADYLASEVLSAMAVRTREFLQMLSICSQLSTGLAAALSDRPDAARLLEDVCRDSALVQRTAPDEYRIQALFRSYLVADLKRRRPRLHRQLETVAAQWWADAGDPVHALRHAERSGDGLLVAGLLRRSGVRLLLAGEHDRVRRGLAAVGAPSRASDPWLALIAALTHADERALPAVAAELRRARRVWPTRHEAGLDALRTSAELVGTGWLGLLEGPSAPAPDPEPTTPELEALVRVSRAVAELVADRRGTDPEHRPAPIDPVRVDLERVVALARVNDFRYLEVHGLALLAAQAATHGDYRRMVAAAQEAIGVAARHGRHPSAWSAGASSMLAYAELLAGDPETASGRATEALTAPGHLPPEAVWVLRTVLGTARGDLGERTAGLLEARAARAEFGDLAMLPAMLAALAVLEHRSALLQGNAAAAAEVAAWLEARVGRCGEVLLVRAWAEAAAGHHEAAHAAVAPVRAATVPVLLPHTQLEVRLIDAEAALETEHRAAALAALDAALAGGAALGVVRPFVLAGPRTVEVLPERAAARAPSWFSAALAAARTAVHAEAAVLLSERELDVLALLPSLLSSAEIAAELVVSVNTVKSHTRSIYAKLGVSTRREAVLRAHERGLL